MEAKAHLLRLLLLNAALAAFGQEGTKVWEFGTSAAINSAPALGTDGAIYSGSMDGKVYALNPDGSKRWDFATHEPIISCPALDAEGNIYIGSLDGKFYSLNLES